jgi:hypothetical protein
VDGNTVVASLTRTASATSDPATESTVATTTRAAPGCPLGAMSSRPNARARSMKECSDMA